MASTRTIQYVGGSEEEAAHLRLLLRQAKARLQAAWVWDDEDDQPDLLLADPTTLPGDAALDEARRGGRAFVCLVDRDATDSGDWQLRRPFKAAALVRVVNALTPSDGGSLRVVAADETFFTAELGAEAGLELLDPEAYASIPTGAQGPRGLDETIVDPEELFRRDPLAGSARIAVPYRIDEATTFDKTAGSGAGEARRELVRDRMHLGLEEDPDAGSLQARAPEDLRQLPLVDFLDPSVLPAPAVTRHGGLPALALDPRNGCFHSAAALDELELYCLQMIPMTAWQRLTTQELQHLRDGQPARPFEQLRWLHRLMNSNQRLAPHLDPGGRYWLTGTLALPDDYRTQQAIAAAMTEPRKLHEIAARAGASVGEVINVVNAFDAVGLLAWELRDRLRPGAGREG